MATKALVMKHGEAALYGTVDEVFSQGEKLVSMGLDVPAVTRIFLSLHARGVPVRTDVYTNEQAAAEFLRLVGKEARA
jgi:energy-coupling factor transport system ATP-binding protein